MTPAVVLLHAGVADRTMWDEHLEPLEAAGYRVVAPEVTSDWNEIVRLMDEQSIDRAALVGNSFGGAVALRVAAVAPERVSALVLISAPPPEFDPSPELEAAWEAEEEALERNDLDAAVEAVVQAWTSPGPTRERVRVMQRRAFEQQTEDPAELPDPVEDDPSILTRFDIPALVAAGEHDMIDFRRGAEEMAAALPRARHVLIAGAGHLAPMETPEAFGELLSAFLRDSG